MLKNKVSRVIALVATVCCLGGAAAGLTAFAVNATNASKAVAAEESPHIIQVKQPQNVTFYVASTGAKTKTFEAIAGGGTLTAQNKGNTAIINISKGSPAEDGVTVFDVSLDVDGDFDGDGNFCKFWYQCSENGSTANFNLQDGSVVQELPDASGIAAVTVRYGGEWQDGTKPVLSCEVVKTTYNVSANAINCKVVTKDKETLEPANANENYQFVVTPTAGYQVASVTYNVLSTPAVTGTCELKSGYYEIPAADVKGAIVITVNVTEAVYTVNGLGEKTGYTVHGQETAKHGSTYEFGVEVTNPAKIIKSVKYSMGNVQDKELVSNGQGGTSGTYRIPNVTADITITVALDDNNYSITFPSNQRGYTITKDGDSTQLTGLVTAGYGELKFKIGLQAGYTGTPVVTFVPTSGQAQTLGAGEGGVYTLTVNSNGTINVDGITQETYTVEVTTNSLKNYVYTHSTAESGLTYGGKFIFTVTAQVGYKFDGYTVAIEDGGKGSSITPQEPNKEQSATTYTLTVQGNVTVTLTQKEDAIQKYTVSLADSASDRKYTIKVDGAAFGDTNNQVAYGNGFSFTVVANKGYTVTGVYAGNSPVPFLNNKYTITVTDNVAIHVVTVENTLTVTYMNSLGELRNTLTYSYTTLEKGQAVPNPNDYALGGTFTYLQAHWYKEGEQYTDEQFDSSLIAGASTSITLNCRYDFNTKKSAELLGTFTATYRDDNEGADGWNSDKSYLIVKLAIDGDKWRSFLNELNALGASLTAVGFTYSNAPQGILGYTDEEISNKIAGMTLATGNEIGKADEKKQPENGAVSRLYGYRWDKAGVTQENQVQFIKGIDANVTRYVGGWFAVTINGVRTVIQSDLKIVKGTPAAKKPAPVEAVLNESAPTDESDEEPTIE